MASKTLATVCTFTLGCLSFQSLAAADDWNVNANGNWNTASNWLNGTIPNGIGDVADVIHNISGNRSITLDTPITLGTLRLGDTNGGNYFILQGQTLTFDNGGAGAILDHSVGTVTGGPYQSPSSSDRFTMPVILNDDLTIYAGRNIQFYNTWDAQGNDLTINDVGRVYFVGSNGTSNNGRIANVGTINVNAGELRFDGQAGGIENQVDAQTIELGTGTIVGTRPYARLFLVNTEATQDFDLNMNGYAWFINDLGNNDQTFTGDITLTGAADLNLIDLNDPGSQEIHTFTGTISGTGGFTKLNTGAMLLTNNNTFEGDLIVNRGRSTNLGSVQLSGANGALSGTGRILLDRDGSLYLDNSSSVNNDRINDSAEITLRSQSRLRVIGNNSAAVSETAGALRFESGTGQVNFDLNDSTPQNINLTFDSLTRNVGAIAQFQVIDNAPGSLGSNVQLHFADNGASTQQFGGGGSNGSTNQTLVIGVFGGVNNISNHFMTFDSADPTLLRPLDFNTEYLLSQNLVDNGVAHTLNTRTIQSNDQNLMINYNTSRAVDPDPMVDWYAARPIRVTESVAVNSLRFGTNTPTDPGNSNNNNEIGSTLVLDPNTVIYLGDKAEGDGLAAVTDTGSGMLLFGRDADGTAPGSNQYIIGGALDFGSREIILYNESGNSALIRSEIRGTGGLTKGGAQTIYLDNANTYTGTTTVAEGILDIRHSQGLGGSKDIRVSGNGSIYLELGIDIAADVNLLIDGIGSSHTVLRSNSGNNSWNGDIIVDNVDELGQIIFTPYINVSTGDTLTLNGNIYGADLGNPKAPDINLMDARIISTESSSSGIININGTFQDNAAGVIDSISGITENDVLRFQVTGNDQLVVNVRNQWNAAGRIYLEQGYLRYEGEGNFWSDEAAAAIIATNGQSGMRLSGGTSGNVAAINLVLTKDGQKINIDRIDFGGNGSSDNYNDLGNIVLAGTQTSGTVTFGNGTSILAYGASDSTRSHTRDLAAFATNEGIVNIDFRLDDTDTDVHTSFTKIGDGTVNLRGDNTSNNGDVEQVNLAGGLLRLTNYGTSTGSRFDNGAMVIFAGGDLELDGVGSVANETENFTGKAVGGSTTFPAGSAKTIIAPGSSNVIVTSDAGRTTTLNIGDSTITLDRQSGGTLNFVKNSNGGTSNITLNGIGAPIADTAIAWATFGDSFDSGTRTANALDFAMVNSSGDVSAFTGSTREEIGDAATWTAGADVSEGVTGLSGTSAAGVSINTLHFDYDGSSTLTLDAGGLTINSGGIMVSSAVGTLGSTKLITGGDLTAGAGNDLIIHQYGADALTIESNIIENSGTALVKTGTGELILTGTNTYTGGTFINGGTVTINSTAQLGAVPASAENGNIRINGGTLNSTADMTLESNRGIMIGGNGGGINVADSTTLTYGGIISAEPNLIAGYATPQATGNFIKSGTGNLVLTSSNNTFTGLLDIQEGTVTWSETGLGNSTVKIFGTNNEFMDGTILRSGATLHLTGGTTATNSNASTYIEEWFQMEAGSTLATALVNTTENPNDRNYFLRGVIKLDAMGQAGTPEGAVTFNVGRRALYLNDDGGYLTGDGSIQKIGAGSLYFRDSSPEWTGQIIINEGSVGAYSAGASLGSGTLPILLGHDGSAVGETPGGNSTAALYIRNESGFNNVPTITQDIIVRNENGLASQTKRLGSLYMAHLDVSNFDGNITLNDNVEFYYQDDSRNSAGTGGSDVRNDTRSYGAPYNSESVFMNFNGDISGSGNISTNIGQGGNGNSTNGSTTGAMDDLALNAYFGLNGDNSNWTGNLTISFNNGGSGDDTDRIAIIRLGNDKALGDNLIQFGARGYLQMAGLSKTFTQNALFIGGSGLGTTAKIQNASETDITLTFFADATKVDSSFQDIGVGMEDGLVFGGKLKDQGLLNVVKSGPGHTVFGASTGGGDIFDSFSSYKGSTTIEEGILYAGSNNSLSPYSRFIVNDGATLSLYFDEASTGFENTLGSLSGGSAAFVNIDSSILSLGGDGTTGADFAGLISGLGNLYKVGTGSQRLSGDNTFEASEVAVVEGALIGGSNTAFGNSLNIIQLGGVPLVSINPVDARVELLLDGSANAMDYYIQMNAFDGNAEGVTIIGTRATSGTYGFSNLSYLEATSNYFARVDGTATFQFGGEINDLGYETTFTKIGAGTVEFHQSNLYGSFGSAGLAIDGGTFIREGFLSLLNEGALASTVVELGDIRHTLSENVYLATSSPLVTPVLGSFNPDSDGITGSGNGAFLFVSAEIDGVLLTGSDIGKRILVKDEHDHPERNGVYEVVSVDTVRNLVNLVRASDFDEDTEMIYGTSVLVDNGNQSGNSYFMISPDITSVNAEETDPVHWEQESTNANLGLYAGLADLTITNDIDINDTNGTGSASIGGLFTSGNSTFTGNITLQHQDGMDNIREVTLASASNDDSGTGEAGTIFTGILSESDFGDTLHVRIDGGGTVTLTSDSLSYTGKTTVGTDSTLRLYGDASIATSQWLEVESGGIFDTTQLNSSSTYTAEVPISGNGTVQPGVGNTLVISGDGVIRPGLSSSPYIVATAGDQIGSIAVNGDLDLTAGGSVDRVILQMGSSNGADYNDAVNFTANSGAGFNAWLATQADTYDSYTDGNHDRLTITGDLSLDSDGYIHFDNDGGNDYNPQYGDIFNLLDWGTLTQNGFDEGSTMRTGGLIGDLYLPNLPANWFYNTSLFSSHGLIVVVPEPGRASLLLGALLLLTLRRRRSPSLNL